VADWLLVALLSLGVFRIARMIAWEDGPFDAFAWVRGRLGQGTWVGRGFHCVLCLSFWIALPAGWYAAQGGSIENVVVYWMGIAGAATLIIAWLEVD
jgi:hypothetical protein